MRELTSTEDHTKRGINDNPFERNGEIDLNNLDLDLDDLLDTLASK
jgi:hypothetical protein